METTEKSGKMKVMPLDPSKRAHAFMGPLMVDQAIRQAIMHCWMALPDEQKTTDNVEKEIMRLVQRALKDMKDDASAFDFPQKK